MKSESEVQAEIRIAAGAAGILLWRNNNGACTDDRGRQIRYGLGNDSAQVQRRIKSSDLIGIAPSAFGNAKLQALLPYDKRGGGMFLAVECKEEGWRFPASWRGFQPEDVDSGKAPPLKSEAAQRTLAQWRYLCLVHRAGGLAGFAQDVADFKRILQGELVLP